MNNVLGIHHVTAVTSEIRDNLRFYTEVMGLRLVKKSVNQDDVSAYHLFYADAVGSPGTDLTFFDWPKIGPNMMAGGQVSQTTFRVAKESLDWWQERVEALGLPTERGLDVSGRDSISFADPEGQALELVDDTGMPGEVHPWTKSVPEEHALRGILGVDLSSVRPAHTQRVLTEVLGFNRIEPGVFEVKSEEAIGQVRLLDASSRGIGRVGAGGVHHVAFRVRDDEHLREVQERAESLGLQTSGYVDRFYFHSVYFREPGGVLFELATDGPGMHADEPMETLGERLALPPFLEGRRESIEAGLKPLG